MSPMESWQKSAPVPRRETKEWSGKQAALGARTDFAKPTVIVQIIYFQLMPFIIQNRGVFAVRGSQGVVCSNWRRFDLNPSSFRHIGF